MLIDASRALASRCVSVTSEVPNHLRVSALLTEPTARHFYAQGSAPNVRTGVADAARGIPRATDLLWSRPVSFSRSRGVRGQTRIPVALPPRKDPAAISWGGTVVGVARRWCGAPGADRRQR